MQGSGSKGPPHKPFLIDPAEEGRKPQGVDGAWWAYICSGWVQLILPKRFRGLPPLFYWPALAGVVLGSAFLFFRILGVPIPVWVELAPAPPLPNAALDVAAVLMAVAGIVQGIGTLYLKKWGLRAAYAWFTLAVLYDWLHLGWLQEQSAAGVADVVQVLGNTGIVMAFTIYYHNRRRWFGVPAKPAQPDDSERRL